MVNKNEAPRGFFAIAKPNVEENICGFCDWRSECQSGNVDFEDPNNRCMSFPVVSVKTGEEIQRKDGKSVIFKRAV